MLEGVSRLITKMKAKIIADEKYWNQVWCYWIIAYFIFVLCYKFLSAPNSVEWIVSLEFMIYWTRLKYCILLNWTHWNIVLLQNAVLKHACIYENFKAGFLFHAILSETFNIRKLYAILNNYWFHRNVN